jgi:hypothetical protein
MREARQFTAEDKLRAVEHLIKEHRWAHDRPDAPEHHVWRALKSIAADLRAGLPESADRAVHEIQRQVDAARRSKSSLGHVALRHQEALVDELLHHWPAIRQKLNGARQ